MTKLHTHSADFLIITPLEEEWSAVQQQFPEAHRLQPNDDDIRIYSYGEIAVSLSGGAVGIYRLVFISLLAAGRVGAATATADAIRRWQPRFVILVGIAGGAPNKVKLGDILVADQVVDYESQKIRTHSTEVRYKAYPTDPRLLYAVQALRGWQSKVNDDRPDGLLPERHIGTMITGDKVLADAKTMSRYQKIWPKLVGVEMEAGGVASAVIEAASRTGLLMIRAVSDLANVEKDNANVTRWRHYTCQVAAIYLRCLLESGPVPLAVAQRSSSASDTITPQQAGTILYDVLRDSSEFDAFCVDKFPEVYRQFGSQMTREARHTLLLVTWEPQEVLKQLRSFSPDIFKLRVSKFLSQAICDTI